MSHEHLSQENQVRRQIVLLKNILLHVAAIICLVLMFWGGPTYYSPRSILRLWNLGHIFTFSLWSYLFLKEIPLLKDAPYGRKNLYLLVVCFFIGGLIEILQGFVGRKPDWMDLLNDMIGAIFTIAFLEAMPNAWPATAKRVHALFRVAILAALLLASTPLLLSIADELSAIYRFPLLADFETAIETDRWTAMMPLARSKTVSRHGKHSLKIPFTTEKYAGVWMKHFPRDWRKFKFLRFSIYNPGEDDLEILCRIHDVHHRFNGKRYKDRFNRNYTLDKGWTDIDIDLEEVLHGPTNREMDLARIESFGLFVSRLPAPRIVFLDYVRLE